MSTTRVDDLSVTNKGNNMGKVKKMRRSQGGDGDLAQQYMEDTSMKQKSRAKVRLRKEEDEEVIASNPIHHGGCSVQVVVQVPLPYT